MGTTKFSTVKDALLPTLAQIWRNGLSTIFFLLSPSTAAATVYILEQYKILILAHFKAFGPSYKSSYDASQMFCFKTQFFTAKHVSFEASYNSSNA